MQPEKEAGTVEPYGAPRLLTCCAPIVVVPCTSFYWYFYLVGLHCGSLVVVGFCGPELL